MNHTHKKTFIVPYQGFNVTLHVLAFCPVTKEIGTSCMDDFVRKQGRKKLKGDVELTFPTTFGAL